MLNQCFLLHFYVSWEELRPLVTSRAYDISVSTFKEIVLISGNLGVDKDAFRKW